MQILEKALYLNIIIVILVVGGCMIKLIMMTKQELRENKKIEELKLKLDQEYGMPKLMKILGRDQVEFPIFAYGGKHKEVGFVESLSSYTKDHYWTGLGADYIVDKSGHRYTLEAKTAKDLSINLSGLETHTFESIQSSGDVKSYEDIKTYILDQIQIYEKKGGSIYSEYIYDIQQATSIWEIVYALKKSRY